MLLMARARTRGKARQQRIAELLAEAAEVRRQEAERAALDAGWRAFGEAVGERMPAGHLPPVLNLPDWWRR